jgi:sulfur carrier protein
MLIILNGKKRNVNEQCSIADLLKELGQGGTRLVVELNAMIINKDQLSSIVLKDGDVLEIVRLVGGG